MKRSVLAGITAGSVLTATAGTGIAAAWQQTAGPTGWGMMGSTSSMHGVNVRDEADYLTHMVAHHQEAVAAAKQLQRSGRAEMRTLGASIVSSQSAEIATMNKWLATWYRGHSPTTDYHPMMRDLSKLSGDALDETFLRDMIPHHMMAVMMSQQLLMHGGVQHEPVATFAAKVRDDQHAEMFQMRSIWLTGSAARACPAPWAADGGGRGLPTCLTWLTDVQAADQLERLNTPDNHRTAAIAASRSSPRSAWPSGRSWSAARRTHRRRRPAPTPPCR
ncbi:DUF305 domain-containing protein [Nonomuraea deserti]|uniref:DUF305 domain-containing protein n=1 Tax=Nonomuraea deserti TaxID=1848322 RepID=A0A4R4VC04_9ACTN|nr:DUF305 domain-containing protein [Nonomuraea deserti]TDD02959.1 DUF305 domain-containing protein [Nonomuraea deserti]